MAENADIKVGRLLPIPDDAVDGIDPDLDDDEFPEDVDENDMAERYNALCRELRDAGEAELYAQHLLAYPTREVVPEDMRGDWDAVTAG